MSDDPRGRTDDGKLLYCSFCGKSQHEVRKLIAGPSVFVCDECVELCNDIIREELEDRADRARDKLPKPHEIRKVLDEYVIGQDRAKKYDLMGGTNTPWRRRWQAQMNEGRAQNFYHTLEGTVDQMKVRDDGMVVSMVKTPQGVLEVAADFVIDCTGLEADVSEHRVLADLLEHSGAGRNPVGRLDVERTFELRGTSSAPGVIYSSGAATLGGYFPGVDTFLGLQIAAQEITDDLARRGFCRKIGPGRSVQQWLRWARNRQP